MSKVVIQGAWRMFYGVLWDILRWSLKCMIARPDPKRLVIVVWLALLMPGTVRAGETTRVSVASDGTQGNHISEKPSISADGRYVAFVSWANNLVPGDTNNNLDVFVHDRQTGQTTRVSVASDGTQGNGQSDVTHSAANTRYISANGTVCDLTVANQVGPTTKAAGFIVQ